MKSSEKAGWCVVGVGLVVVLFALATVNTPAALAGMLIGVLINGLIFYR